MDVFDYNSKAWDHAVKAGNPWTRPVSTEDIARARKNDFRIVLTPRKHIPRIWLQPLKGKIVLCLASGGGQQGPILAAAGACVTVFDASKAQLEQDEFVARRDSLTLNTVHGDMRNLSSFQDFSFDLVIHPVSNCFVPDIKPVWREAYRILKPGGSLLSGFNNPISYGWDRELREKGVLQMKYSIPYSDLESLSQEELTKLINQNEMLDFSHTLESQIQGQIEAGFVIAGFYEDKWGTDRTEDKFYPRFLATRALKMK